ncbi:hypothetical protein [Metabacillus fastidiosus]|uniref:hypothetical protein n=1 Tax=Metabacillus fastidiosus TaxID=1458 RepID=UPI003D2B3723
MGSFLINTSGIAGTYDWLFNVNGLNNTVNLIQNTNKLVNSWNAPAEWTVYIRSSSSCRC